MRGSVAHDRKVKSSAENRGTFQCKDLGNGVSRMVMTKTSRSSSEGPSLITYFVVWSIS